MIQLSSPSWFSTNAPAAWIAALIAFCMYLFTIINRKRPPILVFKQLTNSKPFRIWPRIKDRLLINFDNIKINNLGQTEAIIYNNGSEIINEIKIKLKFPEETKILDILIEPSELNAEKEIDANVVLLKIPFLNPFKDHKQKINIIVLMDGISEPIVVSGTGVGWSVIYKGIPSIKIIRKRGYLLITSFAIFMIFFFWYISFLESKFGITKSEWSLRAFYSILFPGFIFILLIFLSIRFVIKPLEAREFPSS